MPWLAIDLGTTSIKGAELDLERKAPARTVSIPFPPAIAGLPSGFREFDPAEIVQSVVAALDRLIEGMRGEIRVVLCGQMHGYIFMDRENRACSNFMSWQDGRSLTLRNGGDDTYFSYTNSLVSAAQKTATGNECHPGLPIYSLQWHRQNAMQSTSGAWVASLGDFVVSHLCGGPPRIDLTHAAAFGLYDIEADRWHEGLIGQLGYDRWRWPEVVAHGEVSGSICYKGRQISFFVPVGDQQCALLGAKLNEESLSINVSTGSQVSRLVSHYSPGEYQTRPFIGKGFLNTVTRIPAGRALNVLFNLVTEMKESSDSADWDWIEKQVEKTQENNLTVDSAFFPSAFGATGSITNIREDNFTVGQLFRATYASLAENYCKAARHVWPEQDWKHIVLSGGVAHRSRTLRELISRKFGRNPLLPASEEETLLGALSLAIAWN